MHHWEINTKSSILHSRGMRYFTYFLEAILKAYLQKYLSFFQICDYH